MVMGSVKPSKPIRARILIKGSVQGVNYRYRTVENARKLGIKGIVRNLPDGDVEIFCEAKTRQDLDQFILEVSKNDFVIVVEQVQLFLEGQFGYSSHPRQSSDFGIEY